MKHSSGRPSTQLLVCTWLHTDTCAPSETPLLTAECYWAVQTCIMHHGRNNARCGWHCGNEARLKPLQVA